MDLGEGDWPWPAQVEERERPRRDCFMRSCKAKSTDLVVELKEAVDTLLHGEAETIATLDVLLLHQREPTRVQTFKRRPFVNARRKRRLRVERQRLQTPPRGVRARTITRDGVGGRRSATLARGGERPARASRHVDQLAMSNFSNQLIP